jgi:two-component system chemotaxis response regulator CheB
MNLKPIKVLLIDDSSLARKVIAASLAPYPDIVVVGAAKDAYEGRELILSLEPDVVTLDIEMPRMDGITFLKIVMEHRPMPVIIMSSLTVDGSLKAVEALQAGAVDVMDKPSGSASAHADGFRLAEKIRAAAQARCRPRGLMRASERSVRVSSPQSRYSAGGGGGREIILLGASTGGTVALKEVLTSMSGDLPGICIVQHIPAKFSKAFADRLNQDCQMEVREAVHGDVVRRGLALIAPGGFHMVLKWAGNHYAVELNEGPQVHYQRPAVNVLFDSAVRAGAGPHATVALLTGMGADGAAGMLHLKDSGAFTIAQNEETCVVFGMPREAIKLGAAGEVLPLNEIGPRVEEAALARLQAAV